MKHAVPRLCAPRKKGRAFVLRRSNEVRIKPAGHCMQPGAFLPPAARPSLGWCPPPPPLRAEFSRSRWRREAVSWSISTAEVTSTAAANHQRQQQRLRNGRSAGTREWRKEEGSLLRRRLVCCREGGGVRHTRKNRRRAIGWRVRLGMARTRPSR